MTAIPKNSPYHKMMVEFADAKIELQRMHDDDLFLRRHLRANELEKKIAALESAVGPVVTRGLTEREVQVLQHLARGLSNATIGLRLHLSADTVRTHRRTAMSKMHARTTVQAVARAMAEGIIEPE